MRRFRNPTGVVGLATVIALAATAHAAPDRLLDGLVEIAPAERVVIVTTGPLSDDDPERGPGASVAAAAHLTVLSGHDEGARRAGRALPADYDLVLLTLGAATGRLHVPHRAAESRIFTLEAFRDYRQRLAPDGRLAILSRNERLLMRAVLTAWESGVDEGAEYADLRHRSWVLKLGRDEDASDEYRVLYLEEPGPVTEARRRQVLALASRSSARVMLGPGLAAQGRWAALDAAGDLEAARGVLRREISGPAGTWIDLATPTDRSRDFFRLSPEPSRAGKFLLALCVVGVLGATMLPLARHRRVDAPDADDRPPIPVLLGPFVTVPAGVGLALLALVGRAAPSGMELAALLAALVPGLALAGRKLGAGGDRGEDAGATAYGDWIAGGACLGGAALTGALALLAATLLGGGSDVGPGGRVVLLALAGFLLGAKAGPPLAWVARRAGAVRPEARPWGWVALAFAAAATIPVAPWLEAAHGTAGLWIGAVVAHVAGAVAIAWIAAATRRTA